MTEPAGRYELIESDRLDAVEARLEDLERRLLRIFAARSGAPNLRLVTDSRPDAGGHGKPTRHEGR